MTHKDFVLIAAALATAKNEPSCTTDRNYNKGWSDGVDAAISAMAIALATTNPRFDRARFLAAANGEPVNGRDRPA